MNRVIFISKSRMVGIWTDAYSKILKAMKRFVALVVVCFVGASVGMGQGMESLHNGSDAMPVQSSATGVGLVINELMQSNIDCIMDDINEFPDSWVELFNTGTEPVNIAEYKIGITRADSAAWMLPFPQNYKNQRLNKYSFFTSSLKNALLHTSHKSKGINHI